MLTTAPLSFYLFPPCEFTNPDAPLPSSALPSSVQDSRGHAQRLGLQAGPHLGTIQRLSMGRRICALRSSCPETSAMVPCCLPFDGARPMPPSCACSSTHTTPRCKSVPMQHMASLAWQFLHAYGSMNC